MSKNREAVTCNGRAAFYAAMWDDIRQCAMNLGWAVALHGSLDSDMDIMAMPWTEEAVTFVEVVDAIVELFDGNELSSAGMEVDYESKPFGRIVASIPIWEDFYLDISTMWVEGKSEVPEKKERIVTGCTIRLDNMTQRWFISLAYDDGYAETRPFVCAYCTETELPHLRSNDFIGLTEKQVIGLIRDWEVRCKPEKQERRIVEYEITCGLADIRKLHVKYDDGTCGVLCEFYTYSNPFIAHDFLGMTENEAKALIRRIFAELGILL